MRGTIKALCLALIAAPAGAVDLTNLTDNERAAFRAELRALFLEEPALLADPVLNPPVPAPYADEVASDLALIAAHARALFAEPDDARIGSRDGTAGMAVFVEGPAPAMLAALADARPGLGIAVKDMTDPATARLAEALGLDLFPSYVLPDLMVRGDVPAIVLERYLNR